MREYEDPPIESGALRKGLLPGIPRATSLSDPFSHAETPNEISDEFFRQCDLRALPNYAKTCHGEGWTHDAAMLLGALGWDA